MIIFNLLTHMLAVKILRTLDGGENKDHYLRKRTFLKKYPPSYLKRILPIRAVNVDVLEYSFKLSPQLIAFGKTKSNVKRKSEKLI